MANGGLVYLMEEDRHGALIVIATPPYNFGVTELRVAAFDKEGNRHDLPGREMARFNVDTENESVIERFRLDPQKLARDKVEFVGFEASVAAEKNPVAPNAIPNK
ncbi:MAG TPA: hypothetical protein VGH74_05815 [Planctomycetaceae bacterium]